MNGQMIYNAKGDQFIITELMHPAAYPSACGKCGDVRTWQDIQDNQADMNIVVFALSLYKDAETPDTRQDAATAIVTCKGCGIDVIEGYFKSSLSGIANLRAIFGSGA